MKKYISVIIIVIGLILLALSLKSISEKKVKESAPECFEFDKEKGEIIDPRINNFYFNKYNPEFEFKPIKVKRLKDLV